MAVVERIGANRLSVGGYEIVGDTIRFLPKSLSDAQAIAEQIPNVHSVVPGMWRRLVLQFEGQHIEDVIVRATLLTEPKTTGNMFWPLKRGTYLSQQDQNEISQVAIIGPTVRDRLFADVVDPVGKHFHVGGFPFEVKGILAPHPRSKGESEIVSLTVAASRHRTSRRRG